jgi:hypothetical protein
VRPPQFSLGAITNIILFGLVILSAVTFLPAQRFFQSEWLATFINSLAIQLPSTLTPQPWITLSYLVSFATGLSWLYLVSTQDLRLREVRFELRLFSIGIALLAAICIALYLARITPSLWHNERNFGPFPSPNQNGDLFALAGIMILASAQDDFRRKRKLWIAWLVALILIAAALGLNSSPSGIAVLVVGSALFLLISLKFQKRSRPGLAVGALFFFLLLTPFLVFGQQIFQRFHLGIFGPDGISWNLRWRISHETFRLIRDAPWCGIGFGNFEPIFTVFRDASLSDPRGLYPESDWLWLWTEVGWVVVVLTILGIALFIARVFPLRVGTNGRYRLAALIGVVIFAIRGFVDVSGHQVGTAFAAMFLLGLTLHRPLSLKANRWVPVLFRILGLALLATGVSLVVAARGQKLVPGSVGVSSAKQLSVVANRERNFAGTIALTTRALSWAPLDWQLYLARGIAEVELQQATSAVADFRRARFLEPIAYEVPLAEGNAWLPYRPVFAVTAWREALRRAGPLRPQVYASLLSNASLENSEVSPNLEEIALSEHDLVLPYLNRVSGATFNRILAQLLRNDPNLQSFSETEKLALFALWSERGEPEEVYRIVEQHPDWLRYAWAGVAKYKAGRKDFHAAYELIQRYGEPVAVPSVAANLSLEDLQKRFAYIPNNYRIGYELYRAQMQKGQIDDALLTAHHFSEQPTSPAYFHFLEAQCWAEKQDWEQAWNAWQEFHAAQVRTSK